MTKHLMAIIVATCLWVPQAAGKSSNAQDVDRQGARSDIYLPYLGPTVPPLNVESRTKLPKSDMPAGRYAGHRPKGSSARVSLKKLSERRMP